jgi:hypothetical protein
MATGVMIKLTNAPPAFRWTVEGHVGPGCPNQRDDVQLVQFSYWCLARNPAAKLTAAERAAYMKVVRGAPYSGGATDPLTIAIKTNQAARGGTQDGRISPVQNSGGLYAPSTPWMIVSLTGNLIDFAPEQWPALHRMPGCPADLAARSIALFTR